MPNHEILIVRVKIEDLRSQYLHPIRDVLEQSLRDPGFGAKPFYRIVRDETELKIYLSSDLSEAAIRETLGKLEKNDRLKTVLPEGTRYSIKLVNGEIGPSRQVEDMQYQAARSAVPLPETVEYQRQIEDLTARITRIQAENTTLEATTEAALADKGRSSTRLKEMEETEQELKARLHELTEAAKPERALREYVADPDKLLTGLVKAGYRTLLDLVPRFETFNSQRERRAAEKAAQELGLEIPPDAYEIELQTGKLSWDDTKTFRTLSGDYKGAQESLAYLAKLKSPQPDMPDTIRSGLIDNLTARKPEFDKIVERFKAEKERHRELEELVRLTDIYSKQVDPLVDPSQTIIYPVTVNADGLLVTVPVDERLATKYLGALVLGHMDGLGPRAVETPFYAYSVSNPDEVTRTAENHELGKLGIRPKILRIS